jgi:uncharacterized membrane protein
MGDIAEPVAEAQAKGGHRQARRVTVKRPRQALYDFWRNQPGLSRILENVVTITEVGENRYRWRVKAPGGAVVEWVARVTEDVPGERIAWVSEEGADIANSGAVTFEDAGPRGSIVGVVLRHDRPGGWIGKAVGLATGRDPALQLRRDLRRFKQMMETGEIATSARTRGEQLGWKD